LIAEPAFSSLLFLSRVQVTYQPTQQLDDIASVLGPGTSNLRQGSKWSTDSKVGLQRFLQTEN
ncbi:hypothetical protein, partial [Vibrio aestuarianus]